ncbi:putative swib mdm2 domain protein [Phaeoacremonium minimum UCRPA7]|uniref:Putative swib mdm2 domain protein n=1 Tax=Phaeoacremonium minimum (strain UCR-PA7) TaxID=1286976 RepID=R8BB11_PHAM7|nr:putative swib mdm2 domain protein [Phaeoacremonium minimum UCRPA7]EON96528.1 putative swib mdm2 domain protein [Phaeoacremonium minimum UCRPA7]
MSAPLTSEEKSQYTGIIDAILATADLATISRKKVRQGLERALGGKDLSEQKIAIKALIEARFDAISSVPSVETAATPPPAPLPSTERAANGHSSRDYDEDEADAEIQVSFPAEPAKKKQKRESTEDDDARLAALLQAQENQLGRSRTTRGGGPSKVVKNKKKTPKKKSASKIKADDDSDLDASGDSGTTKKRKAGGGFQKEFNLSYPLAELCGTSQACSICYSLSFYKRLLTYLPAQLSRPQVVKRLWEHIKANELQDPSDKRQIRCDEKMQAIFKQARVDMFQMNKLLGNQLYPLDE